MCISGQVYYTKNYKKMDFTNLGYHTCQVKIKKYILFQNEPPSYRALWGGSTFSNLVFNFDYNFI